MEKEEDKKVDDLNKDEEGNLNCTEEANTEVENLTPTKEENTEVENLAPIEEKNIETEETIKTTKKREPSETSETESRTSDDSEFSEAKSDPDFCETKSDTEFCDAQEEIEKSSKHSLKSNMSVGSNIPRLESEQNLVATQTDLSFPPPSRFKKAKTPIEIDIQTSITCIPTDSDSAILNILADETQRHIGQSMRYLEKKETTKSFLPLIDLNGSDQSIADSENKVKILDLCKTPLERKLLLTINHLANEMHSLKMFHAQFLPPEQEVSSEIQAKDHIRLPLDTAIKPMYDTDLSASVPKIPSNTFDSHYIKPEYYSFPMYDVDLSSSGEGKNHICNVHCRVLYEKIAENKPIKYPVATSSEASVYEEAEDTIDDVPETLKFGKLRAEMMELEKDEDDETTQTKTESGITPEESDITASEVDQSPKSNENDTIV